MSRMYEKVKQYYDEGLWGKERVWNVYLLDIITEEECLKIVGEDFFLVKQNAGG